MRRMSPHNEANQLRQMPNRTQLSVESSPRLVPSLLAELDVYFD
jgi:hypothetical protein